MNIVLPARALADLSDVHLPGPAHGQVLTYNSVTEKWTAQDATGGVYVFSGLEDVDLADPAAGHLLVYDAIRAKWVNTGQVTINTTSGVLYCAYAAEFLSAEGIQIGGGGNNGLLQIWDAGSSAQRQAIAVDVSNGALVFNENIKASADTLGFYGVDPVSRSSNWSMTGFSENKSLDDASYTIQDIAEVLATLINTLADLGLLARTS